MRKYGKCEMEGLKELQKKIEKFQKNELDQFIESCVKELAARLLAKVIKRTPVGVYEKGSGKVGGTLRRGWTIGEIRKEGSVYKIEIINPTEYSSYVEFGHRTANHKGWVKGRFMMTISEKEIRDAAPAIMERKLQKKLEEIFK